MAGGGGVGGWEAPVSPLMGCKCKDQYGGPGEQSRQMVLQFLQLKGLRWAVRAPNPPHVGNHFFMSFTMISGMIKFESKLAKFYQFAV